MDIVELVLLSAVAGFTIFFGLPVARMRVSANAKGMLNAASVGILLFLLMEIFKHALDVVEEKVVDASANLGAFSDAVFFAFLLILGLVIGLLGLVWFEKHFLNAKKTPSGQTHAVQLAYMIALGIGFHNFAEGLAIGQSYALGSISLALLLVIGFGLHNATEGFGIASSLAGFRPKWGLLFKLGLIGGGPTFVGALLGSVFVSAATSVFFLSIAAGSIIYVIKEMLFHGRINGEGVGTMAALLIGFLIAFGTDLVIVLASGG
jgi:zinc transporter ZupT